jgi:hypothetical protein
MPKKRKQAEYIVRNPSDLNLEFYEMYNESFLLTKALALLGMISAPEALRKSIEAEVEVSPDIEKRLTDELKAEIHFTEFHQFECFFALLIAIFQKLPHWLFLTTYEVGYIKLKVQAYLDRNIESLTNGQLTSLDEFLNFAIYDIYHTCTDEDKRANWQINLDNIAWILDRMARKYIERIQEYNSYKHGLRITIGSVRLGFIPNQNPAAGWAIDSGDAATYLELKMEKEDKETVYRTLHSFNIDESLNHLLFMRRILETIKSTRLAKIKGEAVAKINTFLDLNKDVLSDLQSNTIWRERIGRKA